MTGTRLAALTGLAREGALLRRSAALHGVALDFAVGGLDQRAARDAAIGLAGPRPGLLVSFGVAGGLRPELAAGTLGCPEAVIGPDGTRRTTDAAWRERLGTGLDLRSDAVAGCDAPVAGVADKRELARRTGAGLVDMESHLVAEAAAAAAIPVLVLRAVADPAERAVPPAFAGAVGRDGRLRPLGVLRLLGHPVTLWRLGRDSGRAFRSLRTAADALCRAAAEA